MYILGLVILVFFAVVGLASFAGELYHAKMRDCADRLILLIPHVDEDTAEMRIRSAIAAAESIKAGRIICVCSADDPAFAICERLQEDHPILEIVGRFDTLKTAPAV